MGSAYYYLDQLSVLVVSSCVLVSLQGLKRNLMLLASRSVMTFFAVKLLSNSNASVMSIPR